MFLIVSQTTIFLFDLTDVPQVPQGCLVGPGCGWTYPDSSSNTIARYGESHPLGGDTVKPFFADLDVFVQYYETRSKSQYEFYINMTWHRASSHVHVDYKGTVVSLHYPDYHTSGF